MKLKVKVDKILEMSRGVRQDGSVWLITPIVFEEVGPERPQNLVIEIFDAPSHRGIELGVVGELEFAINTYYSKNGNLFNRLRLLNFIPEAATATAEPKPEPETYDQPPL